VELDGRTVSDGYRYGYQGSEKDNETKGNGNSYTTEFRQLDPRLGRWLSVDPLAKDFLEWSPFNFVMNKPLILVDLDGKAPTDIIIKGKNKSSVTLKTDLIDITVDASSLDVDFGGKFTLQGEDVLSAGLDIVGILDPTGVADGLNAGLQAKNGNWLDAEISALGIIPYVGDVAKVGKISNDVKIIDNAIKAVKAEQRAAKLSKVERAGKNFTKAGKEAVIDVNKSKNKGDVNCTYCGTKTVPATKSTKGVTPSKVERQVDHIVPKSKGGSGTPKNGQVLCRDCNTKKSNNK